jgi:hypothetical protein
VVEITIEGNNAVFQVEGLHKLWSLRSRLEIPLSHITHVESDPDQVGRWWHGIKLWGTHIPGFFAAGTFYYDGELVFWDVRDPASSIIVSLNDERYRKLIVEVANPGQAVGMLRAAIAH